MGNELILVIIGVLFLVFLAHLIKTKKSISNLSDKEKEAIETDAKRFAKLLIAEIKLLENDRVQRGIENKNVYELLKYKIEDAREVFKKRIEYDELAYCFDIAVVEHLADGNANNLGQEYLEMQREQKNLN